MLFTLFVISFAHLFCNLYY